MDDIKECSLCHKDFGDMKVAIEFHTETKRLMSFEKWEKIGNLDITNKEVVCKDCFNKFADAFAAGMESVTSTGSLPIKEEDE